MLLILLYFSFSFVFPFSRFLLFKVYIYLRPSTKIIIVNLCQELLCCCFTLAINKKKPTTSGIKKKCSKNKNHTPRVVYIYTFPWVKFYFFLTIKYIFIQIYIKFPLSFFHTLEKIVLVNYFSKETKTKWIN